MIETSWQASILVLCILAVQKLFGKRMAAHWRYNLWLLLVLRLLLPALPSAPSSIFNLVRWERNSSAASKLPVEAFTIPEEPRAIPIAPKLPEASATTASKPAPSNFAPRAPFPWKRLAISLWLSGAFYFALRLAWTNLRFTQKLNSLPAMDNGDALEELKNSADRLGVRPPALMEVDFVAAPCVYGLVKKKILLPTGFVTGFSRDELRQVFLHELAHIRRCDVAVSWLVACIQAIHWFNPVLWLGFARMRSDRELATDALVLKVEGPSRAEAYGEAILKVLAGFKTNRELPQLVGILESKVRIKERLQAIARYGIVRPSAGLSIALACGLVCFTLTGAVEQKNSGTTATNSAPIAISPAPDGKTIFTVRVIDDQSKKPIAGITVKVQLEDYDGNFAEKFITTDQAGHGSVEIPSSGLKVVSCRTESPEFIALDAIWHDDEISRIPFPVEIEMVKGIEIGGTVVDNAGKPISGAQIFFNKPGSLVGSRSGTRYTVKARQLIATTDEKGTWRAQRIWPTWTFLNLRVRHPDHADEVFCTELAESKQPETMGRFASWLSFTNKTATLALEQGVSLKGRVLDDRGRPLPLTPIKYADRKISLDWHATLMGESTLITDTDGRFQIAHLPKKHVFFTIQAPNHAPEMVEYDPADSAATKELSIRLKKGMSFKATVKDSTGQPVPEARVRFGDWSLWQGVKWETTTDSQGRFSWDHAPDSKFMLVLSKPGYLESSKIVQGGEEKELRLSRTLHLFGDVLDASTKQKIQQFRIAWTDDNVYWPYVKNVTGSNGVYSLDLGRLYTERWGGNYFHRFMVRIEADGYEPMKSRMFESRNDSGDLKYDFALKPSRLSGTVIGPDGQPVQGAQVALKSPNARLRLAGKPRFESFDGVSFLETGADGGFVASRDPEATHLVIVHEKGFGLVEAKNFKDPITVKLQPWARVEGTVRQYATPLVDEGVNISSPMLQGAFPHQPLQFFSMTTTTDSEGRYKVDYLPAGKISICRQIKTGNGWTSGPYEHIQLEPGQAVRVDLGGKGRAVVGRFKIKNPFVDVDLAQVSARASSLQPKPPESMKSREELKKWSEQPEIARARQNIKSYTAFISKDGAFRMDDVIPGKYTLSASMSDPRVPDAIAYNKQIIEYYGEFEVPSAADQAPLDIGLFELPLKGQPGHKKAPDFTATDLADEPVKLTDYRGKYVLLDFWATWCGPCIGELPYLRKAHERFGARKDFVIIGVSFDKTTGDLHKFVEKNKMPWTQWFLPEPARAEVETGYEFHGIPAMFLINPEGKIISEHLEGVNLLAELQRLLP